MRKLVTVLIAVLLLTSCTTTYSVIEKHENGKMIWIPLSEGTKEYREKIREQQGNVFLSEEYYSYLLAGISDRTGEQPFPEVETKNNLSKSKYGKEDVYTLDKGSFECIVLYIHGGAYVYEIDPLHVAFCDKLVDELNAKVYMPIYPLAPQAEYNEAYELLDKLYPELLSQNKPIYIMGDSAGGGLSLAYVEYLKTKGQKLPEKIVLLSPWLDVTMSNPDMPAYEAKDLTLAIYAPLQIGKLWAGELDTKNPLISPLFGDLEGLPPTLLFVATDEIMYPDVTLLYNKMKDMGQNVSLVYGEGLWHVFVISNIPEAEESIKLIKKFVK